VASLSRQLAWDEADGRTREALDGFWQPQSEAQRTGVEAVGLDLWSPYYVSTIAHVPDAQRKIVHDPFHLVRYMNEAVDDVHKAEHRRLQAQDDDTLKDSCQLWLYGQEHLPPQLRNPFATLRRNAVRTARA
jgi:transposase